MTSTPPTDTDSMSREAFRLLAELQGALVLAYNYTPDETVEAFTKRVPYFDEASRFLHSHQDALSPAQSEAGERDSFLGAMGGADYDDFRSAALRSNPGVSTPPKDSEATNGGDEASALVARLTRPIISIENRTQQEAFDIMCDRIRVALGAIRMTPESELDNAAKVAAKLTEAQRRVIEHGACRIPNNDECVCLSPERADLTDLDLVMHARPAWLITSLGLAVRTALADRGGDR